MIEVLGLMVVGLLVLAIAVMWIVDAATLFAWTIEPLTRFIQRVFLGIDKVRTGPEALEGSTGRLDGEFAVDTESGFAEGYVRVDGERWRARTKDSIAKLDAGTEVVITKVDGLILEVEALSR